jgi:hypothetical protein
VRFTFALSCYRNLLPGAITLFAHIQENAK